MKQIEIAELGRGAPKPVMYPALTTDALVLLAQELESYWSQGAIISPVYGEQDSYTILRKPSLLGGRRNLRIRIVEVGIDAEDTAEIVIGANDIGTEEYSK